MNKLTKYLVLATFSSLFVVVLIAVLGSLIYEVSISSEAPKWYQEFYQFSLLIFYTTLIMLSVHSFLNVSKKIISKTKHFDGLKNKKDKTKKMSLIIVSYWAVLLVVEFVILMTSFLALDSNSINSVNFIFAIIYIIIGTIIIGLIPVAVFIFTSMSFKEFINTIFGR